jgi:hypothetical protein
MDRMILGHGRRHEPSRRINHVRGIILADASGNNRGPASDPPAQRRVRFGTAHDSCPGLRFQRHGEHDALSIHRQESRRAHHPMRAKVGEEVGSAAYRSGDSIHGVPSVLAITVRGIAPWDRRTLRRSARAR